MPLSEFFADQFRQIKSFMLDPAEVVRVVRVDPDLKPVLLKALAKMDDEPDNPHAMLYANTSFTTPESYFTELLQQLEDSYRRNEARLEARGTRFVVPYEDPLTLHPVTRFHLYASALADTLPSSLGSLVFLLDPDMVHDTAAFYASLAHLAEVVASPWLKFLVLDVRLEPRLDGLDDAQDRVGSQTFYMAPDEIEEKLKERARSPDAAEPAAHRRNLGVLAGFAFGRRDFQEAARLQFEWATRALAEDAPAEAASAFYNLGNTMLEAGDLQQAEHYLARSCDLALENSVNGVLPLALTNLGVTLYRQNRVEEAVRSLEVAYKNFKAQNHRPGEAFIFDTLASIYHAQQRHEEAEHAWLAAFQIYDGITSEPFSDLRESGREDIRAKLERFYRATGRPNRIPLDRRPAEGRHDARV